MSWSKSFCVTFFVLLIAGSISAQSQEWTPQTFADLTLRSIGPASMSGRIVDLAVVEKDPYIFYVAAATGGVWKTSNNGVTFQPVFENEGTHSVGAMAVHQAVPDIVWVGTGERANRQSSSWGDGLYKSNNGGKSWKKMGLEDSHHIGRIALHPTDTNIVYVAAMGHLWGPNEERGLYKSTNGGKDWERILHIDENTGVVDIAMDPSDPNILYAAAYQRRRRPYGFHGGGPGSGLYKSTDGGKNWKELTTDLPKGDKGRIGISIYRKDPKIVYVCVEQGYQYNASTAYNRRKAGIYRSEDKGESWTWMSDWNPRPMYASQILVDPGDDQRIYMMNSFSYSDDGGKKFTTARQTLHGDDRILWVNPSDSRHVIKGDDGGLGISYDRAKTWLFVTSLPLSQFYRVSVDMEKPYNIYGGLQDNGSWVGPSETYRSDGILNSDWTRTGGGDGFLSLPHPEDQNLVFVESQYLGLAKLNLKTRERKSIRPGDLKGRIGARRNWDAWGPDIPEPELGNAMAPANWDGPFLISPHAANTIYAGTNILWKSTDAGDTWQAMGDLTTKVKRRDLLIMGQRPDTSTASLDDGIPYYPTLTAIAESPVQAGVLYVGTDDGQVQVSKNGGKHWSNSTDRIPGLPASTWINGIEASRFAAGTAYVAINNYRNNDFKNYLFKTTDFGNSWQSITGDLPADRVVRTLREDPKNPDVLYLGTELGLFISGDGGRHWIELKNNMPTMAFNDLVIHPRDNDLIVGTHNRGIWILDNVSAIQELKPSRMTEPAALFSIQTAERINYSRERPHAGNMIFRGENPPRGAIIDYYLGASVSRAEIQLEIYNSSGERIRTLSTDTSQGVHRVTWDLEYEPLPGLQRSGPSGPPVIPGLYTAVLSVKGQEYRQDFQVLDDPRLDVSMSERRAWTEELISIADLYKAALKEVRQIQPIQEKVEEAARKKYKLDTEVVAEAKELDRMYGELFSRISSLYYQVSSWTGLPTNDQFEQKAYYQDMLKKLAARKQDLLDNGLKKINKKLDKEDQIEVKR